MQNPEASNRADPPTSIPTRWIKSPAWDLVWVLNALWLAPLILLLARGHDDVRASPVDALFFAFTVPLWFGHRVSSAWLAYATPAYRPLLATQRLRFVDATALMYLSRGLTFDPLRSAEVLARFLGVHHF